MATDTWRQTAPPPDRSSLRMAWLVARRELRDTLRDWRILSPILILTLLFPWLMNWTAQVVVDFVQRRDATIIGERLIPFLLMIVGFFPISFSLIIALETFVGEKERRSIEPLLSMPITDFELYLGKMISATALPLIGSILGISVYLVGLYASIGYAAPLDLLVQIFALNIISAVVMVAGAVVVSSQTTSVRAANLLASYSGMAVYLVGLKISVDWTPTPQLFAQVLLLTTVQGFIMVAGAVVISSQTTSVRAANLLASFIIVPMALMIQAESVIMFWGNFDTLWLVALGLVIVAVILMRMGVRTFNREEILGREIDELNLRRTGQLFRHFFLQPPGNAANLANRTAARGRPLRLAHWLGRVYRHDLPYLVRHNWQAVVAVALCLVAATILGWVSVERYPIPQGVLTLDSLSQQDFESVANISFLPSLTTSGILGHNVRALLLAGLAAVISLGVLAILMLMLPLAVVGFFAGQMAWLGYSPLAFLAVFILPHGLFEIPAALIATAFALRLGASVTAPREGMTVGEGMVASAADFCKVFIFLVIPLLLVAAFVEANVTPQLVVWAFGS